MSDVSLANLPIEAGRVPGTWRIAFRDPMNDTFAGVLFVEGISQAPIEGQKVRHLVAAMGGSIRAIDRLDGDCSLGDMSAFPKARPSLAPAVARIAPASDTTSDISDAPVPVAEDELPPAAEDEGDGDTESLELAIPSESTSVTRSKRKR